MCREDVRYEIATIIVKSGVRERETWLFIQEEPSIKEFSEKGDYTLFLWQQFPFCSLYCDIFLFYLILSFFMIILCKCLNEKLYLAVEGD